MNGVWKWICGILSSVLLTGLAAWFAFGHAVSAEEVRAIVQRSSPYVQDKQKIEAELEHIKRDTERIEEKVDKLDEALNRKLDRLLETR